MRGLLFALILGLIILMNIRSAKLSVGFVKIITILKLIPLFAIIIFGFSHIKAANLHWEHLPSLDTFGDATLILFFAFAGFETSISASGEIKNPKRTLPLGLLLGGGTILIIYILLQTVTQGVLGNQVSLFKDVPLAAVAEKIVGPVGVTVLLIAAAISCLGTVSSDVLSSPRTLFAGAKDGLFPRYLAKVHPRHATPYMAVITYAILIFIFSVSGGFKQLAVLASCAVLIIYLAVVLAMVRFRFKKEEVSDEKTFRVPGGLVFPVIAVVSIIWLLSHLSSTEILSTLIFIAIICAIYFVMDRFKKERPPVSDPDMD
ncbi:MAG: amino acid permease [Chitinophagaceae bacterium]|nr:amino acid permease [Chitinophagaceae bacterium]